MLMVARAFGRSVIINEQMRKYSNHMYVWMDGWMDGCMYVRMYVCTYGPMDVWTYVCMYVCMNE